MARLVAPGGFSVPLPPGKVTLGAGPGADVQLPQTTGMAPVHAEIRPLLGGYVLKHLGGETFKTHVNGNNTDSLKNLADGDTIQIGELQLTLELTEAAPAPVPTVDTMQTPAPSVLPSTPPPLPIEPAMTPLPPLPAILQETPPAFSPESLPPLPAILQETPPAFSSQSAGAIETPDEEESSAPIGPIQPIVFPNSTSQGLAPATATEDLGDPNENVTIKLPRVERLAPSPHQRKPFLELVIPSIVTLLIVAGGVIFLQHHNEKLAGTLEAEPSLRPNSTDAPRVAAADETPEISTAFTEALSEITQDYRPPRNYEFPNANFLFNAPGKGWVEQNTPRVKDAQVNLTHPESNCHFIIVGEPLLKNGSYTEDDLKEAVRRHMGNYVSNLRASEKGTIESKQLSFKRCDARGRLNDGLADELHYFVNLSLFHGGYFYQLVTHGKEDEAKIQAQAYELLRHFDIADRQRTLIVQEDYQIDNIHAKADAFKLSLNRRFWEPWKQRELKFPGALVAGISSQGSVFGVMPMRFESTVPDIHSLTSAFLATLDIPYPSEEVTEQQVVLLNGTGKEIQCKKVRDGALADHQFQIIQRGQFAYMVGGWSPVSNIGARREIPNATKAFALILPEAEAVKPAPSWGQAHAQSKLLHHLGNQALSSGDPTQALAYFKEAVENHPPYYEAYLPLANAFRLTDRATEGVTFYEALSTQRQDHKVNAALSVMQCLAGNVTEGKRLFDTLITQGHYDQPYLLEFMRALMPHESPDKVITRLKEVDGQNPSFLQDYLTAVMLNQNSQFQEAYAILQELERTMVGNPMVAAALIRSMIGLNRKDDAFALAESAKNSHSSGLPHFLRGACQEALGQTTDALASYRKAAQLSPLDRRYAEPFLRSPTPAIQLPDDTPVIATTPAPSPTVLDRSLTILTDGSVQGEDRAIFAQDLAQTYRERFASTSSEEQRQALDDLLRLPARFEVNDLSFANLQDPGQPLEIVLSYRLAEVFRVNESRMDGSLPWPLETALLAAEGGPRGLTGSIRIIAPTGLSIHPWTPEAPRHDNPSAKWTAGQDDNGAIRYSYEPVGESLQAPNTNALLKEQVSFISALRTRLILSNSNFAADSERD